MAWVEAVAGTATRCAVAHVAAWWAGESRLGGDHGDPRDRTAVRALERVARGRALVSHHGAGGFAWGGAGGDLRRALVPGAGSLAATQAGHRKSLGQAL